MNSRQRRKKIAVLVALLLLLLLIALALWYFLARGSLPIPQVPPDRGINCPNYLYSITGSGNGTLLRPLSVAVDEDNRVYVADSGHARVAVFTSAGRFLFAFNKAGNNTMLNPVGVAISPTGDVYVADRGRKKLWAFTPEGRFIKEIKGPRKPQPQSPVNWAPVAMTFDAQGNLYVTDTLLKHQVLVYSPEGKELVRFGRQGQAPNSKDTATAGWFWFPDAITLDNEGNIWVADSDNRRLQVYDREGKFDRIITVGGLPRGAKFYDVNMLLVTDTFGHDVGVWDKKGNNLCYFGERGTDIGQFRYPSDVWVGPDKKIYVPDTYNNRVQVWAFAPQIPPQVAKYIPPPWCCLIPLLLLPLLLLLRRKKYLATDDFLQLIVENEKVNLLENKRMIVMEETYDRFKHITQDELEMAELLEAQEYDEGDAAEYMEKYDVDEYSGRLLSMTPRKKYLLTEDPDLRRIATALDIETLNYEEFIERFEEHEEE